MTIDAPCASQLASTFLRNDGVKPAIGREAFRMIPDAMLHAVGRRRTPADPARFDDGQRYLAAPPQLGLAASGFTAALESGPPAGGVESFA